MPPTVFTVYDNFTHTKRPLILDGLFVDWSQPQEFIVREIETDALGGDAPSQVFLDDNRAFIKNSDGVNRIIRFGGVDRTFVTGTSYSLSIDEAAFFVGKAQELGFGIDYTDLVDYIATGVVDFYFE